ncbi:MAG: Maf family protein [Woeseiaceae bacterium]|nr:Maf family protein [Woeseiaceae bacterium]
MEQPLHLASSSPRRAELLTALGLQFTQLGVDVDESRLGSEDPADMVLRLASEKANAAGDASIIIGADTAVVLGDEVFGKPRDREDAIAMLTRLSGCVHQVMTGVAVRSADSVQTALSVSDVRFRSVSAAEASEYWDTDEPADKAGAYAIQGRGGIFVESMSGSYSGVVGLPVYETAKLLAEAGIHVLKD